MIHDVTFESQFEGIADSAWQWRGCGIIALHMALQYWHARDPKYQVPTIEQLRMAGIEIGASRRESFER